MIPIFRAKKINNDEYVEGTGITDFLNINTMYGFEHYNDGSRLWIWSNYSWVEIDKTTLAIHFLDILDSQGNKIFASLQEDGKGGDILEFSSNYFGDYTTVLYFKNHRLITHSKTIKENTIRNKESLSSSKVIGIQQ